MNSTIRAVFILLLGIFTALIIPKERVINLNQRELELYIQEYERRETLKDYEKYAAKYIKIVDKLGQQVPMILNSIQARIDSTIADLQAQGKPVRLIILKARQEGCSTYIQSKILYKTATQKNRNALITAHRDDSTNVIFGKAKYMYNNLPEDVKPLQKASNARELIFDTPAHYKGTTEGLNSKIQVQTASGEGIGRSDTYFDVHLSEFAFYPGNPKTMLAGILQAVPRTPDSMVIIESTANGFNDFKELWDTACSGENEFTPLFFPWHEMEEYQMPVTEKESLDIKSNLTEYEQNLNNLYGLSIEQIAWYRWTLANTCNGDHNMMKQENPSNPEEAFLTTGRPVFLPDRIISRLECLRKEYKKHNPKKGYFSFKWRNDTRDLILNDTINFIENDSYITIYEEPKPGFPYVIGGDTKGEGKDKFAAQVINNTNGKQVAVLHGDIDPDTFSHQMYCLGMYYNKALIGIEINFDLYPIKELERLQYYPQYKRQHFDSINNKYQDKNGWKTDGNTRPMIISNLVVLMRDNSGLINDIATLEEMLTFIYTDNGKPDAMSGKHDDLVMSLAIAYEIRPQQNYKVSERAPVPKEKKLIDILIEQERNFKKYNTRRPTNWRPW